MRGACEVTLDWLFSDELSILDWDRSQLNYAAYDAIMLFGVTPLMSILGMCAVYSLSLGEVNMGQIMSSLDNGCVPLGTKPPPRSSALISSCIMLILRNIYIYISIKCYLNIKHFHSRGTAFQIIIILPFHPWLKNGIWLPIHTKPQRWFRQTYEWL